MEKELTFGQQAVGLNLNFNHAEEVIDERVHKAKQLSADLIDLIEKHNSDNITLGRTSWMYSVLRTAAFNAVIAAQMACVKFITWNIK
jgi:hypothetical protein